MVSARYEVNTNNIAGAVAALEASTHAVRFLGAKRSAEECEQACVKLPPGGCTSFTWHHAVFDGGAWARGCYARTDGVWQPVRHMCLLAAAAMPHGAGLLAEWPLCRSCVRLLAWLGGAPLRASQV